LRLSIVPTTPHSSSATELSVGALQRPVGVLDVLRQRTDDFQYFPDIAFFLISSGEDDGKRDAALHMIAAAGLQFLNSALLTTLSVVALHRLQQDFCLLVKACYLG
jgi:hypothetical protein